MNKYLLLGMAILGTLLLAACRSNCYQSQNNLLRETWMQQVDTNPSQWTHCADRWFLAGESNHLERVIHHAPLSKAISTMHVRVCDFTKIQIKGNFQVQLLGAQDHNSVTILGPNEQVRQIVVQIRNGTLYLSSACDVKIALDKVIVRIGIRNLQNLTHYGSGLIEGRGITSDCLTINSRGASNILLQGNMNLARVNQMGTGTITVMGANTPSLHLNVFGSGNVNLSGRVGVQSITHCGNGCVNIIGADTDCLFITTSGSGFTGIVGNANLKQIIAKGNSRVALYNVNACDTRVFIHNSAKVGIAGKATTLTVNTFNDGNFQGSYLLAENVYVRTYDSSHANVTPLKKLFASADNRSSLYYIGTPKDASRFSNKNAVILSIPSNPFPRPCLTPPSCMVNNAVPKNDWTYQPSYK